MPWRFIFSRNAVDEHGGNGEAQIVVSDVGEKRSDELEVMCHLTGL
jgi:hypothetical protein